MSLSTPWTNSSPASANRKNRTSVITDTGANLAALDKTKFKIVTASQTGSGFTLDHAYLFLEDGSDKIDLTAVQSHTHTSSSDGGEFLGIYFGANSDVLDLMLTKTDDLKKAQWIETVTSTGSIEDNTDGTTGERAIRLRTNGTSGATATISYPHIRAVFSSNILFQTKLRIETFSSIALHTGIGCDDTSAADSNTRKLQAEVCTVTNNNWWLRTANGSATSASDTGIAATANRVAIKIEHFPDLGTPESDLYIDGGTVLQKTTNIPIDGSTAENNLIKHSVKNSTAADRPLLTYGSRIVYDALSTDWL